MAINRDKVLKTAEKLVQKGKIEQAIREYEKMLKLNVNDVNTINRVGDLYNRIGQVDKAVEHYEKIANAYATDGFTNKAIAIYKKINRLAPDRVDIFKRLAELYLQQGLTFEAKSHYQTLADWFLKNDDIDGGIEVNRRLIEIDPDNHIAHLRLADLLLRKGEGEEGIGVYDRLGRMLLKAGKTEEAERLYRHAIEQNPPDGEFIAPMCEALIESGNIATAREFYGQAMEISPDASQLKVIGLRLAMASGEGSRALEMSRQLLETHGEDPVISVLAGQALLAGGEGAQGRDILLPVANRAVATDDINRARDIFSHLIKALPQDPQVLKLGLKVLSPDTDAEMLFALKAALAERHFREGESDIARRYYLELHGLEPENDFIRERVEALGGRDAGAASPGPVALPELEVEKSEISPPEDFSEEIEIVDFESDPEILEFGISGRDLDIPGFEISGSPETSAPKQKAEDAPPFDPEERIAEASVFAKYGLFDKAIDYLEQVVDAFPEEHKARERLVLLAIEADKIEKATHYAGELESYYLEQGQQESLDALYRSLPALKAEEVPDLQPPEEMEIEILDIATDFPGEQGDSVPEDTGKEVAVDISASGITEIELEEVEIETVDMESLKPDAGLDFEVLDASDFEGAPEKEALIQRDSSILLPEPDSDSIPAAIPEAPVPELHEEQAALEPLSLEPLAPEPRPKPAASQGLDILGELAALEQSLKVPQTRRKPAEEALPPSQEPVIPAVEEQVTEIPGIEQLPEPSPELVAEAPAAVPEGTALPPPEEISQLQSFLEHSFYEDATRLLGRLESEFPESQDVLEARRTLKSKGFLIEELPQAAEETEDLFAEETEEYVDLAAELEEEMAAEEALVSEAAGTRESEADLEDVFREFQKGVAEQLSEEDADTHFNLGIAYKEMGLLPEAIREFQIASRSEDFFVEGCSMIGICYADQGMWEQSASWYSKALNADELSLQSRMALKYDLANALFSAGDQGGAVEIYHELLDYDAGFRDVSQRLNRMEGRAQVN